jgi:hypothetical protein
MVIYTVFFFLERNPGRISNSQRLLGGISDTEC